MVTRRDFLGGVLATGAALITTRSSRAAADAHIEVLLKESIGTINPEIYSHFVEHLGGVVYDGIWVMKTREFRTSTAFDDH